MKIRSGFVSNSSTASFIVKFETTHPRKYIEEDIKACDPFLEKFWNKERETTGPVVLKFPPEKKRLVYSRKNKCYHLVAATTMFNDWMDIDVWPFIRMLSESRSEHYTLLEIRMVEQEYSGCDEVEKFNPKCWELGYGDTQEDIEVGEVRQEEIEGMYLKYLYYIGIKLSEHEIISLAKYQLK